MPHLHGLLQEELIEVTEALHVLYEPGQVLSFGKVKGVLLQRLLELFRYLFLNVRQELPKFYSERRLEIIKSLLDISTDFVKSFDDEPLFGFLC